MPTKDESLLESCNQVRVGAARTVDAGLILARPPNDAGEAPLRAYYNDIWREVGATEGRWCLITDGSHITNLPGAKERRLHGELSNAMNPRDQQRCAGAVIVLPNALVRNVATGILWLMNNRVETRTTADLPSAVQEAHDILARARASA